MRRLNDTYIRGTYQKITYIELNGEIIFPNSPIDLIAGNNRRWALEQLNAEATMVLSIID